MFIASKLETISEWELMSTHAEIVSIVMRDLKSIVQRVQSTLLMVLTRMVQLQKVDTPVI